MYFTANYKRAGPCRGCTKGCPFAQITLTLTGTGDYQAIERSMMFAIAASRGKLPGQYSKEEVNR